MCSTLIIKSTLVILKLSVISCRLYSILDFSFYLQLGTVLYYILLQLALWWFFHVSSLFWKINFPLNAKAVESAHRIKYVHITMVLLALVLPFIPVIAAFATTGFVLSQFPSILCLGSNTNASFYSLVLPIQLLLQVGIALLIAIFWKIHKVRLAIYIIHN